MILKKKHSNFLSYQLNISLAILYMSTKICDYKRVKKLCNAQRGSSNSRVLCLGKEMATAEKSYLG